MSVLNASFLSEGILLGMLGAVGIHCLYRCAKHRNAFQSNPYELFLMAGIAVAAVSSMVLSLKASQTVTPTLTKAAILSICFGTLLLMVFGVYSVLYGGFLFLRSHRNEKRFSHNLGEKVTPPSPDEWPPPPEMPLAGL